MDVNKPVTANDGLILFSGSGHGLSINDLINWNNLVFFNTVSLARFLVTTKNELNEGMSMKYLGAGKLSSRTINIADAIFNSYSDCTSFVLYNRGINGMMNGAISVSHFTDFATAFGFADFTSYAIRIKPEIAMSKALYQVIQTSAPKPRSIPGRRLDFQ